MSSEDPYETLRKLRLDPNHVCPPGFEDFLMHIYGHFEDKFLTSQGVKFGGEADRVYGESDNPNENK